MAGSPQRGMAYQHDGLQREGNHRKPGEDHQKWLNLPRTAAGRTLRKPSRCGGERRSRSRRKDRLRGIEVIRVDLHDPGPRLDSVVAGLKGTNSYPAPLVGFRLSPGAIG